ncbi:serine/threonine-protein kinase [Labilithrix luteola]|nr:serine/threonine-protein kinase [Labilithrix luteola]
MPEIRAGGGTYFLGRYRVVDEIGIGGMASVHLARMDGPGGFQKWVAIKKIHPHLVEDDSFVQMFLDEARVAARISHPNVATVFDLGKHEETYWIAMEYLHGEPLREVMRRTEELGTAMPPEIACRVIADASEGLHSAHELLGKNGERLELVHRDVTPHNLFVTYDGVTKVVDFGIAKFSSRMSNTRAGTLKGKLAYMSPEQVQGEQIDRRTDIFALGVVLWELTTGQRLFRMESDLDTLAKVQECNVPRPSTLIRGYPVDLEKIVMKALAKNRGERFKTARELSRALQSLLMRRGLFIASDEVAAYTQSVFSDRIQKREAHLRWAAEVTQTINVEQMLSTPNLNTDHTNSEVQQSSQSGKGNNVRPAAGMPLPSASIPHGGALGLGPASGQSGPVSGPQASHPSHPSNPAWGEQDPRKRTVPMQARGPAGGPGGPGGPPRPAGPSAPKTTPPPPRPAAGMPAAPRPMPAPAQNVAEEPHPADGDGPTIQAAPPLLEGDAAELHASMQNDPPTMMASPQARAAKAAQAEPIALEPDPDDFDEDQDETIVAATRAEQGALHMPPTFPQPPGPSPSAQHMHPRTAPIAAIAPPHAPAYPPPLGYPHGAPAHTAEVAFADTLGLQHAPVPPVPYDPNMYPRGPHASGPSGPSGPSGEYNPMGMPPMGGPDIRMQPTVPRMAPSFDNRTMTVQRYRKRPPMWVVAALSCSIALLIAGVVIAIVSSTGTPNRHSAASATVPSATTPPTGAISAPVVPSTPVTAPAVVTAPPAATSAAPVDTAPPQPSLPRSRPRRQRLRPRRPRPRSLRRSPLSPLSPPSPRQRLARRPRRPLPLRRRRRRKWSRATVRSRSCACRSAIRSSTTARHSVRGTSSTAPSRQGGTSSSSQRRTARRRASSSKSFPIRRKRSASRWRSELARRARQASKLARA